MSNEPSLTKSTPEQVRVRPRLTTTHPHGALILREDQRLGLLRISKNASTELMERLECTRWAPFSETDVPAVVFLRAPVARFLSSVPETLLRVQHPAIEDPSFPDRVIVSEDVYGELQSIVTRPVNLLLDGILDLIEESPFDAHHEPQHYFFTDRHGRLRLDGWAYRVEDLEQGLEKIRLRFGVTPRQSERPRNVGGKKPERSTSILRDLSRRLTATGLYRQLNCPPLLAIRYRGEHVNRRAELNRLANKFAGELKETGLTAAQVKRVERIYAQDLALWNAVRSRDDRPLSEVF